MSQMREDSSQKITIYRPNQRHELGFFRTWFVMSKNIVNSRSLIWQLFKRDFLAIYKKSFIGFTWIFLAPIVGIISWVFLNMTGVLNPGDVGIPYPAYVLIGTSMWGLYMGFYDSATKTLSAGQALVMQVNYPHEALLFKQTAQILANFLIGFVMNIIVLIAFGVVPSWQIIFFPPQLTIVFIAQVFLIKSYVEVVQAFRQRPTRMSAKLDVLPMMMSPITLSDIG